MNLKDYKFIVSSGCSYGVMMKSLFFNHSYLETIYTKFGNDRLEYNYDKDKIIFLGVGVPSQSSEWALHSIQHIINTLLKFGVNYSNIYCFVEWTQYDRITNSIENFIDTSNIELDNVLPHNTNSQYNNRNITELFKYLNINTIKKVPNIGIIENCYYINSNSLLPKQIDTIFGVDGKLMYEKHFKIHQQTTNISFLKNYFNNIISLQNYLKSNGINYNFCNMQSEFDGWVKNGFEYQQKIKYGQHYQKYYINFNKTIVQNLNYDAVKNDGIHILDAYPQLSHLYKLIDFSKWWFYKKDGFKFGGIDEYFLHTYDTYAYSNLMHYNHNEINVYDIVGGYNWHPTEILYTLLHNEAAFNNPFVKVKQEWNDYLINLLNEDINYKGITKHKLSCSKSYYDNIITYEHTKL